MSLQYLFKEIVLETDILKN